MTSLRVLVTGASGFVGKHLVRALRETRDGRISLLATSKCRDLIPADTPQATLDITDRSAVSALVAGFAPTHIVHLAGIAEPSRCSADPDAGWAVNVHGTLNLAYAIQEAAPECWLINVGSGLIYGETANRVASLKESDCLAPMDDYGVTKASADLALGVQARRGLKCLRMRPFNHSGAGQSASYVIPAFAMQIAQIECGQIPPLLRVGNLHSERDFLDVRDVVRAYASAIEKTGDLESGIVMNIASGEGHTIDHVLHALIEKTNVDIEVQLDPNRQRASDIPRVVGNADRANRLLNWQPTYTFDQMLEAVLDDCRRRAKGD